VAPPGIASFVSIKNVPKGAFIAIGAVGLSIGAAWAWSHQKPGRAAAAQSKKGGSSRRRAKRHKSQERSCPEDTPEGSASAPANGEHLPTAMDTRVSADPETIRTADSVILSEDKDSRATALSLISDAPADSAQGEPTPEDAPQSVLSEQQEAVDAASTDKLSPAAQGLISQTTKSAPTVPESAAGEWIAVGRRQRRRRKEDSADGTPGFDGNSALAQPSEAATRASVDMAAVGVQAGACDLNAADAEMTEMASGIDSSDVSIAATEEAAAAAAAHIGAAVAVEQEAAAGMEPGATARKKAGKAKRSKKKKGRSADGNVDFNVEAASGDEQLPPLPWATQRPCRDGDGGSGDGGVDGVGGADGGEAVAVGTEEPESAMNDEEMAAAVAAADAADAALSAEPPSPPPAECWVEVRRRRGKRPASPAEEPRASE